MALHNKCTTYKAMHIAKAFIYAAVKLVTDFELRMRYDKTFNEIKVLEDCGHYKTVYW